MGWNILRLASAAACMVFCATPGRALDTGREQLPGLRVIQDVYGQARTAGLAWYVYPEKGGCRLAKPLSACFGRAFDLKPHVPWPLHPRGNWQRIADYGLVRPACGKGALKETRSTWSSVAFVYSGSGEDVEVTASRLTPAVLVDSKGEGVEMLVGAGLGLFATATGRPVAAGDLAGLSKDALAAGWLLAWHVAEDAYPAYGWHPKVTGVRWDIPVLLVFSDAALSIRPGQEGGIAVQFLPGGGSLAILPLFGDAPVLAAPAKRHSGTFRREIRSADLPPTAQWTTALPEPVLDRCRFWGERLGGYPTKVRETSRYDPGQDAITVDVRFTFNTLRKSGKRFSPIAPILATAQWGGLPVEFSSAPVDSTLVTTYGPYLGIDSADGYQYTLKGLGKYVHQSRRFGAEDKTPPDLRKRLAAEIDNAVEAGIMAPWILSHQTSPGGGVFSYPADCNRLIHSYPGENLYLIAQIMEAADPARRERLKTLLAQWEEKYSCLEVVHTPPLEDARREAYDLPLSIMKRWPNKARNFHLVYNVLPAEAPYCYEAYAGAVGAEPDLKAAALLDPYLARTDWATGGCWKWEKLAAKEEGDDLAYAFLDKEYGWSGCADANRLFAGLVGALRICRAAGARSAAMEDRLWYYFAKTAVLRLAMEKYKYFLYERGLLAPPADPQELKYGYGHHGNSGRGIHTFHRQGPDDDPLAVYVCDEYGMRLGETPEHIGHAAVRLPAYLGMVPELGRFLHDFAAREAAAYCRKTEESTPDWYIVRGENNWIGECDYLYPADVHQLFLARAWIVEQDAATLERYADLAWLPRGDWYYLHKLAETAKTFRGVKWEGERK